MTNAGGGRLDIGSPACCPSEATIVAIDGLRDGDVVSASMWVMLWDFNGCGSGSFRFVGTNASDYSTYGSVAVQSVIGLGNPSGASGTITVGGYTRLLIVVEHPPMQGDARTYYCELHRSYDNLHIVAPNHARILLPNGSLFPLMPQPVITDVQDDEGGELSISWQPHMMDVPGELAPITNYEVQRLADSWQTIATVAATQADNYAVNVATDDILTVGEEIPNSQYRIVARTAAPEVQYPSQVTTGYSIDNRPPPRPVAQVVDDPTYRYIVWTNPAVPDFGGACIYRGDHPGFETAAPLDCPATGLYVETALEWYFYRVQFSDIHGNLSEFSDELHGRWPTPVPNAVPASLHLYPCQPNPFNPRTTIRYDLPENGHVRLSVFDVAGRFVCTLVDEDLPRGGHEVVWDGRDAAGRDLGSGSYLARLEFDGKVESLRMGLIR